MRSGEIAKTLILILHYVLLGVSKKVVSNSIIIFTCEGQCGVEYGLPCSCEAKCVVYNNCCENITVDCPHIVQEGHSRFGHLMTSEVRCTDAKTYVISSCPAASDNFTDDTRSSLAPGNKWENLNHEPLLNDGLFDRIVNMYTNRHVEDTETGFVYINFEVFICNTRKNYSHIFWNVAMGASERILESTKPENFLNIVRFRNLTFRPPNNLVRSACISPVANNCTELPELQTLCDSFTSYVSSWGTYYRNRFCFQCQSNSTETDKSTHVPNDFDFSLITKLFRFSVTFQMVSHDVIRLVLSDNFVNRISQFSWRAVTCRKNRNGDVSMEHVTCSVTKCRPDFDIHLDGQCKTLLNLSLGVGIDFLPSSHQAEEELTRFAVCAVEHLSVFRIQAVKLPTYTSQIGSNETIFTTHTAVVSDYTAQEFKLLVTNALPAHFITQMALIGKALVNFSRVRFKNTHFNVHARNKFAINLKPVKIISLLSVAKHLGIFVSEREAIVHFEMTTLCYGVQLPNNSDLTCWKEPTFISEVYKMNELPCFHEFSGAKSDDVVFWSDDVVIDQMMFCLFKRCGVLVRLCDVWSDDMVHGCLVELSLCNNDSQTTQPPEVDTYVNVEWRRSEQDQSGRHSCTSKKLDGHSEEVICTTQVKFRQNKLEDLLEEIKTMQVKLNLLESKYETCQREIEEINSETLQLRGQFSQLRVNLTSNIETVSRQGNAVNDLKQKLEATTTNVDTVKNTLSSIRTEEGIVYCGSSNEFRLNTSEILYNRVKYVRVNFNSPFNKTPQVSGSIRAVDADKNTNFRYNFMVRNIDTAGFTVVCMTWSDTILHGIDFQWRATTPFN
ncbi:hypothetical protein Btru_067195 [Bulinus truncatus]|nr:hypothetical protein Btru_067195 [Bulinus truncatus]